VRLIHLDSGAVGEKLVYELRDAGGRVLLGAGAVLTERHIEALRRRGFLSIPVNDPFASDILPPEPVRYQVRERASAVVTERFAQATRGGLPVTPMVRQVVEEILDDLLRNPSLACNLLTIQSAESFLFVHSVNVCIYALVISTALGLDRVDRKHLGVGAMLHDIGMVFFAELLAKPGPLTEQEAAAMRDHTTEGFELVRRQAEVDLRSAHVALQHHERLDGSGYPRGLQGRAIHPWAQVVAIAEVFDTVVSGRPYLPARPAHLAVQELRRMAETHGADPFLVQYFCERIAEYPNGTVLELGSGEIAVVVQQRTGDQAHPRIRVLADAGLRLVPQGERDLDARAPATTPAQVLGDYPEEMLAQLGGDPG